MSLRRTLFGACAFAAAIAAIGVVVVSDLAVAEPSPTPAHVDRRTLTIDQERALNAPLEKPAVAIAEPDQLPQPSKKVASKRPKKRVDFGRLEGY